MIIQEAKNHPARLFLAFIFVLLGCATRFQSDLKIHNGAYGKHSQQLGRGAARRKAQSFWINETYKSTQRAIDTSIDLTWGNWIIYPAMNDIALLTLSQRIPSPLEPAGLPEQNVTFETAHSTFLMTGYGVQGLVPSLGKAGDLLFFTFRSLPDPRVEYNIVYKPRKNLFAFDAFRSAVPCDGDSGGPLYRHNSDKDKLELVALFSASPSESGLCRSKGLAFTTVSDFTDKLRCISGSSLSQETKWEMTTHQRRRPRKPSSSNLSILMTTCSMTAMPRGNRQPTMRSQKNTILTRFRTPARKVRLRQS